MVGGRFDSDELEGVLDGEDELLLVHDPVLSPLVGLLFVESLDGYFSEVLFHAEVDQLVVLDDSVVVIVVPKNVFYEVMHFRVVLMQHLHQESPDLLLLELEVLVRVECDQLLVHHLSHGEGQVVVQELETLDAPSRG